LRAGNKPDAWNGEGVVFLDKGTLADAVPADQVICALNKTRTKFNAAWRKAKGYRQIVEPGERVISLFNSKRNKLFNGTQAVVLETSGQNHMTIESRLDELAVVFLPEIFGMEKYPDFQELLHRGHPFDYGYCLTCHKAQGSEWNAVAVIDEGHKMPWQTPSELHRWRYTAASRARSGLTWIKSFSS
jgi:exodeoxyribonuclease-5